MSNNLFPDIKLSDFDYFLPKDRIALYPLEERDLSKLLFADIGEAKIDDYHFSDIVNLIEDDALIILNETKVIGARLHFRKPTGGLVELLLVEPIKPSAIPALTLANKFCCTWECIIGGRNVVPGMKMLLKSDDINMIADVIERDSNKAIIEFIWADNLTFSKILEISGETPLPPYIDREADDSDSERYQTVFAHVDGSVAAPTAGLHFTEHIIKQLKEKGVGLDYITLHIGPGTFQPVEHDDIKLHEMHHEQISLKIDTIREILTSLINKKRIVAVGTTCMRTVESLYWLGFKLMNTDVSIFDFEVTQWEPYQKITQISAQSSFEKIIKCMEDNNLDSISGKTQLMIVPGYEFKIVNALITNFHMPKSTLILLVSAFTGIDKWREIYDHALKNDYRFLSYGDSSYLIKSIT